MRRGINVEALKRGISTIVAAVNDLVVYRQRRNRQKRQVTVTSYYRVERGPLHSRHPEPLQLIVVSAINSGQGQVRILDAGFVQDGLHKTHYKALDAPLPKVLSAGERIDLKFLAADVEEGGGLTSAFVRDFELHVYRGPLPGELTARDSFRYWEPEYSPSERQLGRKQKASAIILGALAGTATVTGTFLFFMIDYARKTNTEADYAMSLFCIPFGMLTGAIVALWTVGVVRALPSRLGLPDKEAVWMGAGLTIGVVLAIVANVLAVVLLVGVVL